MYKKTTKIFAIILTIIMIMSINLKVLATEEETENLNTSTETQNTVVEENNTTINDDENNDKNETNDNNDNNGGQENLTSNNDSGNSQNPKTTTGSTATNNTTSASTSTSRSATLSILGITPYDFSGFSSTTYTYDVSVPRDVETVTIYATTSSTSATVEGTGEVSLSYGVNSFDIIVTAGDGVTTKTYTLNITRLTEDEEEEEGISGVGLASLEIKRIGFRT